ncbi:hypothetical protein HFK74_19490|uniref:DUF6603 domain-containing protein n=1 Tax=Pseudomonas sp. SbOxS1 TaxID=2723884 RepID=UPI0015D1B4E0|nr:DUF6603 domain-containing protein [Pseudomonas sp. SbOxS1]NYU04881.1 hypothetical protein [Pseudomonas sp. SbOxS1]
MANILESVTNLLCKSLEGDPPPPAILQTIGDRLKDLLEVTVDPSGDGIGRWLDKLHAITNNKQLRDTLIVRTLQMNFPRLAETLTLLGIIGFEWTGNTLSTFVIYQERLNELLSNPGDSALELLLGRVQKLGDIKALQVLVLMLISSPQALLTLEYRKLGFLALPLGGVPGINSEELIKMIDNLINSPLSLPLPFDFEQFAAQANRAAAGPLGSLTLEGPDDPGAFNQLKNFALVLHLIHSEQVNSHVVELPRGWTLKFATDDSGDNNYRLQFDATQVDIAVPRGDFSVVACTQPVDANALLLGDISGTHFAIKSVRFGLHFRSSGPLFDVLLKLEQIEFVLKPDFLKFISFGLNIPVQLRFESGVDVTYTQGQGLAGRVSLGEPPGLSVQFATPINLKIGGAGAGVNLDQVVTRLDVKLDNGQLNFRAQFQYGANAQIGPLGVVMDGAGVWVGRWNGVNGDLLPPQGIGLSLECGPVSGGGFLNIANKNEFAGALQLKILGIGAFAYGLYKTLPTGDPSVVALIGIRLPLPGVQLGFGFSVSAFGGLVGINRRVNTDLVRERLASGAAGQVLFNDNPMQNAPKLLGDTQLFFPDEPGIFLIGPTFQLNWLYILKLDAGVFIELPGPRKIFIAGSARLVIGSEEFALVYLRMDFVGGVDLTKSLIFFDAPLVNSHVLGIFRITGGVALRLVYGDNSYFLFTVGGFHPSFNPGAMELPKVARVGVSLALGPVWLKQEMYLAITSNTFQLGSRVEAGIEIGPMAAHGWFGFDALIQFKPFYFIARVDAGFDVEFEGASICSVRVEGQLSGPGPLVLQARASVRLLFIKVSGNVTITLSSNPPEAVVAIANLPEHLRDELKNPDNLRMEGEDRSVVFGPLESSAAKLFAPVGELIWEQKRTPLNLAIEKIEGVNLGGWHTLVATSGLPEQKPEDDWFGVGTYIKLGDSEALNTSRFARQQSGLRIAAGAMSTGDFAVAEIDLYLVKLPQRIKSRITGKLYASLVLTGMLGEKSHGATLTAGEALVAVNQETWNSHDKHGVTQNVTAQNVVQAFVQARQSDGIALPATQKTLDLTGVL